MLLDDYGTIDKKTPGVNFFNLKYNYGFIIYIGLPIKTNIYSKIDLVNLKLPFIKDMLMTPSCYFNQNIILKNFDIILTANILPTAN